jgi:hypothetical protein
MFYWHISKTCTIYTDALSKPHKIDPGSDWHAFSVAILDCKLYDIFDP